MNLYEEFQILEREKSSFYYDKVNYKPVSNLCYAWKFIEEYFKAGEKESVLNNTYLSELKDNGKHIHTVSMYFLGILFRKLFEDKVKNHLISSLKNQLSYRYDFTYSWFITCLFHDYSWIQENDKFYNKEFSDTDSCFTKNVIEKLHIQHIIFRHKLIDGDAFKTHYREETIKNYFHYRCDYILAP
ncbi:MAG: hypothetical protein PHF33_00005 [Candidatus Delongbacteria bacterium]|nr:hypothetical protein [Candidatus Delongbacteria bacterium]